MIVLTNVGRVLRCVNSTTTIRRRTCVAVRNDLRRSTTSWPEPSSRSNNSSQSTTPSIGAPNTVNRIWRPSLEDETRCIIDRDRRCLGAIDATRKTCSELRRRLRFDGLGVLVRPSFFWRPISNPSTDPTSVRPIWARGTIGISKFGRNRISTFLGIEISRLGRADIGPDRLPTPSEVLKASKASPSHQK